MSIQPNYKCMCCGSFLAPPHFFFFRWLIVEHKIMWCHFLSFVARCKHLLPLSERVQKRHSKFNSEHVLMAVVTCVCIYDRNHTFSFNGLLLTSEISGLYSFVFVLAFSLRDNFFRRATAFGTKYETTTKLNWQTKEMVVMKTYKWASLKMCGSSIWSCVI